MNKKKLIILIVSFVLIISVAAGITYAFIISQVDNDDAAENDLKVAETRTLLIEEEIELPETITPGTTVKGEVSVQNTGNIDSFIRAKIVFSNNSAEEFCDISIAEDWEYNSSDGYYYYKKIVEPDTTIQLFESIKVKENKDDGTAYTTDDMVNFDIIIYTESIQTSDKTSDECSEAWSEYQK